MASPHATSYRTSIVLSSKLVQQLQRLCEIHGESQSATIRRLIIEGYSRLPLAKQDTRVNGSVTNATPI